MHTTIRLLAILSVATATCLNAATPKSWAHEHSDLTPDPAVRYGHLDNGMRYAILANAEPPGRVSLRLHVNAGSLNESDAQRGLAHFLEHMVFNGSRNFPNVEELIPQMQRLGISFGAHANAYTSFDETVYMLDLPNLEDDTLDLAFTVMRDFADGALLEAEEIDNERGVVRAELIARDSVQMRLMEQRLEFLMPDFLAANRLPIGLLEVIESAPRERFVEYYSDNYRADNLSFVIVGDIDPDVFEARIRAQFESMTAPPAPFEEPALGSLPTDTGFRTGVFSDEEVSHDSLSLTILEPYAFEPDTLANRIQYHPLQVANAILNRRFHILAKEAGSPIKGGSAGSSFWLNAIRFHDISVAPEEGKWPEAVGILEQELRRALEHGFTQAEVDEITANWRNNYDEAVKRASTRKSPALASGLLDSINEDYVFDHPTETRRVGLIGLDTVSPESCHSALREAWTNDDRSLILTTKKDDPAIQQQLATLYQESQAVAVAAPEETKNPSFAYTDFGPAGEVIERTEVEDLEFTQLRLSNNIRVNLKSTDFQKNSIVMSLRTGHGTLSQPEGSTGLDLVASAVINGGGLGAHSNDEQRRILAGRNVGYGFSVADDAFIFTGSTTPEDLELQLQLLCAGITDPGYRDEALRQFRKQLPSIESQLQYTLAGPGAEMQQWSHGHDSRFAKVDPQQLATYTNEDVRAWLDEELANSYLELSIVGDFELETAIPLILKSFGALPERASTKPDLKAARSLNLPELPATKTYTYTSKIDKAVALLNWQANPVREDIRESRRMNLVASILSDRLRKTLREELGSTYSPRAGFGASQVFNTASLTTTSVCTSAETSMLQKRMLEISQDLAATGASADELDRALQPILSELPVHWRQNAHWLGSVLSASQEKPYKLDWARERDADYASITLEEVNALAKATLTKAFATITLRPEEVQAADKQ